MPSQRVCSSASCFLSDSNRFGRAQATKTGAHKWSGEECVCERKCVFIVCLLPRPSEPAQGVIVTRTGQASNTEASGKACTTDRSPDECGKCGLLASSVGQVCQITTRIHSLTHADRQTDTLHTLECGHTHSYASECILRHIRADTQSASLFSPPSTCGLSSSCCCLGSPTSHHSCRGPEVTLSAELLTSNYAILCSTSWAHAVYTTPRLFQPSGTPFHRQSLNPSRLLRGPGSDRAAHLSAPPTRPGLGQLAQPTNRALPPSIFAPSPSSLLIPSPCTSAHTHEHINKHTNAHISVRFSYACLLAPLATAVQQRRICSEAKGLLLKPVGVVSIATNRKDAQFGRKELVSESLRRHARSSDRPARALHSSHPSPRSSPPAAVTVAGPPRPLQTPLLASPATRQRARKLGYCELSHRDWGAHLLPGQTVRLLRLLVQPVSSRQPVAEPIRGRTQSAADGFGHGHGQRGRLLGTAHPAASAAVAKVETLLLRQLVHPNKRLLPRLPRGLPKACANWGDCDYAITSVSQIAAFRHTPFHNRGHINLDQAVSSTAFGMDQFKSL
ncbi:unnamed protein product [Protopolystoma xenopodis]|uniref:Uncharacterized protein n=1 Tax=Protopolystoma xenopodis TaxID=117903 RepID=A0A3S5A7B5_9PLAT|nr:unnamed protein product [Protopolystoma xenopodis]